ALAGVAWVHTIGSTWTAVVAIVSGLVSVGVWASVRPPVNWRRLPWFVVAYVVWAAASVLWSAWPETTATTWLLLVITTVQGLFVAAVLTWKETVAAIAAALKWVLALSLLFELAVSIFVGSPLLPGFVIP